jgi:hypothetical protein
MSRPILYKAAMVINVMQNDDLDHFQLVLWTFDILRPVPSAQHSHPPWLPEDPAPCASIHFFRKTSSGKQIEIE